MRRRDLFRGALACYLAAGALLYAMLAYGQEPAPAVKAPALLACERELIETKAAVLQARLQLLQLEHAAKVAEIKAVETKPQETTK